MTGLKNCKIYKVPKVKQKKEKKKKKKFTVSKLHLNFWRQSPTKKEPAILSRKVNSWFITFKPTQSCSYMKFTQGAPLPKRQFGSKRKENTTALDSIMKEEGKGAPSPQTQRH